jgi:hypothetical protein
MKIHYPVFLFLTISIIGVALPLVSIPGRSSAAEMSGPHFTDIIVTTSDTHLLLFGELRNSLTNEMIDGLHSGIPVQFSFFVELERIVKNWFNEELNKIEFSHALRYDTLKQLYIVETGETSKKSHTTASLDEAVTLLNEINGLRIVELAELEPDQTYRLRIKADLYKKTLPLKMHTIIPFVSWWDLNTDWYTVEFIY